MYPSSVTNFNGRTPNIGGYALYTYNGVQMSGCFDKQWCWFNYLSIQLGGVEYNNHMMH
jgi:hypothetical protein